jgi:uncharacterized membrane protein
MKNGPSEKRTQPAWLPLHSRLYTAVLVLSLAVIVTFFVAPPWSALGKADLIGYGICHRIPARSFFIAGRQLPLCARCTGTYLGAMLGFTFVLAVGRTRVRNLPPLPVLAPLISFVVFMGVDGINSYLSFFPGAPHLYEPRNWLRLTAGTLNGLAISLIVYPVLSYSFWRETIDDTSVRNFGELGGLLVGAVLLILAVVSETPVLLYPIAFTSILGVLAMLGAVNTMIALILMRREAMAVTWRDGVVPGVVGLAATFLEIGGMALLRAIVTQAAGLPF